MKTILNTSKLILAGLIFAGTLVSCEPVGKSSVLPEFTGEIKLDRTKIGEKQNISASYVIPTGGQNIEFSDIHWSWEDGRQILGSLTVKDGVSTVSFKAPAEVGEQAISFVAGYINLEEAKYVTKSISTKFNVIKCDVLTSFWNDSKTVVVATANEKFEDSKAEVLKVIVKAATEKVKEEFRQYYFATDKLNKIVHTMQSGAVKGAAVRYVDFYAKFKGYTRTAFDVVNIATGAKTAIDVAKIQDVTYTEPISTGVENGDLELVALLNNDKTNITMSYKVPKGDSVQHIVTYVPR